VSFFKDFTTDVIRLDIIEEPEERKPPNEPLPLDQTNPLDDRRLFNLSAWSLNALPRRAISL
jgi:hypothetical protein